MRPGSPAWLITPIVSWHRDTTSRAAAVPTLSTTRTMLPTAWELLPTLLRESRKNKQPRCQSGKLSIAPDRLRPIRGGFFFALKAIMFCDRLCLHHVQCTRYPFPEHLISVNMAL